MKNIILLLILLLSTSCATILNRKTTVVKVQSKHPVKFKVSNDSTTHKTELKKPKSLPLYYDLSSQNVKNKTAQEWAHSAQAKDTTSYNYETEILVRRNKLPLHIQATYPDSCTYLYKVPPTASPTLLINYCNFFLGAFVDLANNKGYTYPKIYFNRNFGHQETYIEYGSWYLDISIPLINGLKHRDRNYGGVGLIGGALEYNYLKARSIKARYTLESGVFGESFGSYDHGISYSLSLTDNIYKAPVTFGYGLSCVRYNTHKVDILSDNTDNLYDYTMNIVTDLNTTSLGIHLNTYFRFSNVFSVGLIYQPTFLNLTGHKRFSYQHLISLDLAFRIPLYRKIR